MNTFLTRPFHFPKDKIVRNIEVGDTVYVLDPDCRIFASCKNVED